MEKETCVGSGQTNNVAAQGWSAAPWPLPAGWMAGQVSRSRCYALRVFYCPTRGGRRSFWSAQLCHIEAPKGSGLRNLREHELSAAPLDPTPE